LSLHGVFVHVEKAYYTKNIEWKQTREFVAIDWLILVT